MQLHHSHSLDCIQAALPRRLTEGRIFCGRFGGTYRRKSRSEVWIISDPAERAALYTVCAVL